MRLHPIVLSILIAASASVARADDDRRAYAPAEPVSIQHHDPADRVQSLPAPRQGAGRLHPEACQSLCRVWEFLGALERPAPPKPVPTS